MKNKSFKFIGIGLFVFLMGLQVFPMNAQALTDKTLALLLPDSALLSDPRIQVWLDAAKEEGLQLTTISDSQLLQLGTTGTYPGGIIMPDQVHAQASDALISTLQNYVEQQGGKLMIVYDAGVLNDQGFYSIPKSRFSALVGVDYVLDSLYPNLVGLGPVTGMESTLEMLQVPPGKSMLYSTATTATAGVSTALKSLPLAAAAALNPPVDPIAIGSGNQRYYLPVSPKDPGG